MLSQRLSVCPCVENDSSLKGANTAQYVLSAESLLSLNLGLPSQVSSIRRKPCRASYTAILHHDGSIHINRATVATVLLFS